MKAKILLALSIILGMSLFLGPTEKSQEPSPKISEDKNFIRKDLLLLKRGDLGSSRRNIFSPQIFSLQTFQEKEVPAAGGKIKENQGGAEPSPTKEQAPQISLSLRYIGYILSSQKIVALIILEGETLAVEEGEMIREEIKVGKITPSEIEIVGPDSKRSKFSLEGE